MDRDTSDSSEDNHLLLPPPSTPLIGRETERGELGQLLCSPGVRLVTLTGPGGVGKTRLALAIVDDVRAFFADGVCVLSLAALRTPDLIIPTLLQALDIRQTEGQSQEALLITYLRERHMLLLLDNFEQLLEGASFLVTLLAACPHLTLLVTSREFLCVRGEYVFHVMPLELPDPACTSLDSTLSDVPSVALFVQRIRALQPTFQLDALNAAAVAEICQRLDGLPLALELAAARCAFLSPQVLLGYLEHRLVFLNAGMRDLPERQQTLYTTIAWSYDLLKEKEQRLFRCLAIFPGRFTIEAAQYVYQHAWSKKTIILEGITSLIAKNLLIYRAHERSEGRLSMLETIREFGHALLDAEREEAIAVHRAHLTCYMQLVEQAAPYLRTPERQAWLTHLERDYDNVRAAMRYAEEQGANETVLRFGNALMAFWMQRGYWQEGYRSVTRALEGRATLPEALLARGLHTASVLASYHEGYEVRERLCQESLALFRKLEERSGVAMALNELGKIIHLRGRDQEAQSLHRESLALYQSLGDTQGMAEALLALAEVARSRMEYRGARPLVEESVALFRVVGDQRGVAQALGLLAFIEGYDQKHRQAIALAEESLVILRGLGERGVAAEQLHNVSELAARMNDHELARRRAEESLALAREIGHREACARALYRLAGTYQHMHGENAAKSFFEESLALYRELGNQEGVALILQHLADHARWHDDLQRAQRLCEQSLSIFVEREHRAGLINGLGQLASIAATYGRVLWATRLLAASDAVREAIGLVPGSLDGAYRRLATYSPAPLRRQEFARAWQEGRAMTPAQVLANREEHPLPPGYGVRKPQTPEHISRALTTREREVLHLLTQGFTNPQIARLLVVSPVTVNAHVRSIYTKLNVSSRSAATRYALEHRLF